MSERDLVQRLKDYAGGDWSDELGQIPIAMVQAAEVIEQYRADHESDEQTNNELRAQRDALAEALGKIAKGPPSTLDEPDLDWEVIHKMRRTARAALSFSSGDHK